MKNMYKIVAPILTTLLWAGLILFTTVTISLFVSDEVTVDTTTSISIFVVVFTTLVWTPRGVQIGEEDPRTIKITELYNYHAGYIVNNQLFSELSDFCDKKNEAKRLEIIKGILADKQIPYDDYLIALSIYQKNCMLKEAEITAFENRFKSENKKGEFVFNKRWKFLQKFIKKKIRFEKLKPSHITQTHKSSNSLVPKNKEYLVRGGTISVKVIWGVLLGIFTGAFILTAKKFGIEEIIKIIVWTASIVGNIFTSIRTGNNSVVIHRCNYLIEKNDYTAEFFKFCNLKITDIDKDFQLPQNTD